MLSLLADDRVSPYVTERAEKGGEGGGGFGGCARVKWVEVISGSSMGTVSVRVRACACARAC